MTDGTGDRTRRRRLLGILMGHSLEQALRDPSLRADLLAEAEAGGPDALLTHDMLDLLAELRAEANRPAVAPELFFSTDRVLIVPGLMGSALGDTRAGGRGLLWVSPLAAVSDRLGFLRLGPYDGTEDDFDPAVRVDPLGPLPILYDLLRISLELRRYTTEFFAFDWRRDLDISACRLARRIHRLGADPRPLHIVAHSQGALVARRALQILGPADARRLVSHLVLLGPANFGSHSAVLALAGAGDTFALLRRLAIEPRKGFQPVAASMSGLYQLLPWDARRAPWLAGVDIRRAETWGPHTPVDRARLDRFLGWGRGIDSSFLDDRTTIILGDNGGRPTTGGVAIGGVEARPIPAFDLSGDGTVPHSLAVLPGVRTLLAPGAEHSMIATSRRVLAALRDILTDQEPALPEVSSDFHDHLPSPARLGAPEAEAPQVEPRRTLEVAPAPDGPRLHGRFLSNYETPAPPGSDPSPPDEPVRRILQAAEPPHVPSLGGGQATRGELILGTNNLLPFHFLRDGDRLGRAVVKLQRADGSSGTGFLVAPDILLTNQHVLPDREVAATTRALANFESRPPADSAGRAAVVSLDPAALFVSNPDLDFTFCGVPGLDYLGVVPLDRDGLADDRARYVNIVQHPGGRTKEVALQDNRVVKADHLVIQYACDTEPGSSGSPVFDNGWNLVAIHHASVRTDLDASHDAPDAGDPSRGRYLNEGIRLSAIAAWLETDDAERQISHTALARLRPIFRGLDPRIGFFGGLGRGGDGRNSAQMVVELYRAEGTELDLGYWDLGGPSRPARYRRAEVARVLAALRLDAWCLAHADPADLAPLVEHLAARHRLDYTLQAGAGPFVLLHRTSAGLAVDPPPTPASSFRLRMARPGATPFTLDLFPLGDPMEGPAPVASPVVDTLFLGSDSRLILQAPGLAVAESLRAAGPAGAFALLPAPGSVVSRVFVAPGVEPLSPAPGRVVVVGDRPLPCSIQGIGASSPMALRISLLPASLPVAAPVPPPAAPRPAELPPAPPPAEALAVLELPAAPNSLEDALLSALRPVLSRLLAEFRPPG